MRLRIFANNMRIGKQKVIGFANNSYSIRIGIRVLFRTAMAYRKKHRKFGRERDQRKAFLRALAGQFISHGKIKTTEARAKELRGIVERAITKGKAQNLQAERHLLRVLPKLSAKKVMSELSLKHKTRPGGYTRIVKLGPRSSDGARMVVLEFV